MTYQTILFDFDGTLLYTVQDLANAVNHALTVYGYPTHSLRAIERMVGNGVAVLLSRALPGGFDTPDFDAVLAEFRSYYSAHCYDFTVPYDGVQDMLRAFHGEGRKMAIVTNKYQAAAEELRKKFFDDTIPLIVGDFEGRERKPAPDGVFLALRELGAEAATAVYVGDTEVDMRTAANAGLEFVAAGWGYRTREELEGFGIERIAGSPAELVSVIRG